MLELFFSQIDSTDDSCFFAGRGWQYRSTVFYHNEAQREAVAALIEKINNSHRFDSEIVARVIKFEKFYRAESYHQNYHSKNPVRYNFYRTGSGRDKFIKKHGKNKEIQPYSR